MVNVYIINLGTKKTSDFNNPDLEKYERRYKEGYNLFDPQYYKWLKSTHPEYAEQWYAKVILMVGSSSQETSLGPSEPSTEVEQLSVQDSSGSSAELELAGEGNKDLEKYTRRYEEGYNIYDPQYYTWLQHTHPDYAKAWYKTAVKIGSAPAPGDHSPAGEQEIEVGTVESSDMPDPSGLSSTSLSNDMEDEQEKNTISI